MGCLLKKNNNNSTMWPQLKSFIHLPKHCILQHGKAFKFLFLVVQYLVQMKMRQRILKQKKSEKDI